MGPKALIAAAAIIGLIGWGGLGLVVGAVGGFAVTVVIGILVRKFGGGMIPPSERRELAESVAFRHPDVVEAAYPDVPKTERVDTLEEDAEAIAERAVKLAPANEDVWMQGNVLRAVEELAREQETQEARALYECLEREILEDWYGG